MPGHRETERAAVHACTCGAHTITRACPLSCLAAVLSAKAFNPLARACDRSPGPGATVGHVVDLHLQRQLSDIDGLGPRRIGEIEVSLVFAGLIGPDSHVPAAPPPGPAQHRVPGPPAGGAAKANGDEEARHEEP